MDMAKYIGETTEYDKKQEVERRKGKSWLKSVSAFANGSGGCLLFGIADDDTIIGLTDAKTDAEFISQKIKERIDPMPQIDLKMERKGSGMGKIINPIKALPYFEERMLPSFFSDRAQFTVTFPNMILAWQESHPDIEVNFVEN